MGKSTSFRNMNPKDTLLIKTINKPLPFPEKKQGWKAVDPETGEGNVFQTDHADTIIAVMKKAPSKGFKNIIVDDGTYVMVDEFMRRVTERGYDKFSEMAFNVWNIIKQAEKLPEDVIVFLIWHIEESPTGSIKLRTVGKLTDEKVDIPAMCTVVLLADRVDGQYIFRTQNTGMDIAKSPIGLFEEEAIPNDMKEVESKIRKYYGE